MIQKPLIMHLQAQKPVLVAYRTREYRSEAIKNIEQDDVVLEIGCHEGACPLLFKYNLSVFRLLLEDCQSSAWVIFLELRLRH